MGWAAEDVKTIEEAQVKLMLARDAVYKLGKELREIKHDEKRQAMIVLLEKSQETLDQIDAHLHR